MSPPKVNQFLLSAKRLEDIKFKVCVCVFFLSGERYLGVGEILHDGGLSSRQIFFGRNISRGLQMQDKKRKRGSVFEPLKSHLTVSCSVTHQIGLNISSTRSFLGAVSYSPSIVTMAVSVAVCEIFSVKLWCDLENMVRVRLRSLEMAPFYR